MIDKIRYYLFVARWLLKNDDWEPTRQKYKALERDLAKRKITKRSILYWNEPQKRFLQAWNKRQIYIIPYIGILQNTNTFRFRFCFGFYRWQCSIGMFEYKESAK